MHWPDQIRHCQRLALFGLLCISVHAIAIAQADSSTPVKPATPSAKQSQPASAPATKQTTAHTSAHKSKSTHSKKTATSKSVARKRGQQAIDPSRAREIQTALIREHYLQGQPTGTWDSASQAAMQKYQADHGWQSKTTPDARALIKLGLGPSQDHLLNPESAMTATSASANAQPNPTPSSAHATASDPKTPAKPTPADSGTPQP
jgi:hypothetical protein